MFCSKRLILAAAAAIGVVSSAQAEPIIRDASLFETLPIEGVSLSTPPEEAFDLLFANGYRAGDIETYEAWGKGSLEFVRGDYSGPEGVSSITLGRADGRLAFVSQSLNRRGIDVSAEIGAVQSHFGIGADEHDCRVNAAGTAGSCELRDAEEAASATMQFTMTALPTMILRSVSRPQELVETLQ